MNLSIFDMLYPKYKPKENIRLIEFFAGYGSQALALKYLGINFEHWKTCEWAIKSIQAYKDIHFTNINIDFSGNLTKENLIDVLYGLGISSNYNEPMTKEQISRLKEKDIRKIYNNIIINKNLVNIQQVKGKDLEIVDTDKYDYILTYSFPCQDLSLAGKGKGMSDTTTRSGMLWEVERILCECKELGNLPQILLMENVPQVHGTDNVSDFNKWQLKLEELGYKNYHQDLIATDYGIPQTRNRCFMISILGDYSYTFPKPMPLKLKLKDMLEDNVDEKYYLSDKMIDYITKDNKKWTGNNNESIINKEYASTLNTGEGQRRCDASNYICKDLPENYNLKIKNATEKGYLEAYDGDGINISSRMEHQRGNVQKEKIQTLTTSGGNDRGVVVGTYQYSKSDKFMKGRDRFQLGKETSDTLQTTPKEAVVLKKELCNELIKNGKVEEGDVIKHSYTQQILEGNKKCVEKNDGNMITLTTRGDCVGTVVNENNNLRIRKLTPKECFRLMGVKDQDYENCKKNQSNASLYHLAGDSIVVNVLMEIFKKLFTNN